MLSNLIQRAEEQYRQQKPFVLFQKPRAHLVQGIFQKNDALHLLSSYKESGFVFAPFDDTLPMVLLPYDEYLEVLRPTSEASNMEVQKMEASHDLDAKEFHLQLVKKGIATIQMGAFKKVVLSRKITLAVATTPFEAFQRLLTTYAQAFCYLWYHPKVGMWMGATPELLVSVHNKRISTMSLAGTQLALSKSAPGWSAKELEEQSLVTEFITTTLKPMLQDLEVSVSRAVKAGNLWHLQTKISGQLATEDLGTIVSALHPTPAVCGFPKLAAKEFIETHENYKRTYYTGYLGVLNAKEYIEPSSEEKNEEKAIKSSSELFVNLRCLQWKGEEVHIYVGGGITSDSIAENEWQETINKSATMLQILEKRAN